jgi:hypothetical protein
MNEDRRRILAMLAEGKISADEAERLLDALAAPRAPDGAPAAVQRRRAKYFRIEVDALEADGPTKVNMRIPMQLLRSGVRLSALMPASARDQVNEAMARNGIPFDISQVKPENLEEMVEMLSELSLDVDHDRAKVRIFCE